MSADGYRLVPEKHVISESLVYEGLVEDYRTHVNPDDFQDQKEQELALKAAEHAARDVDLTEITVLKLSYKNICEIDNLDGFTKMHTLALDNNIIRRIERLDFLVNLTWLDLSFNNLTHIEGLSTLTKLKDLTLYHNQIEVVENLDECKNLECLSLGKNRIKSLDCVNYLRRFPKLRMLNLDGNPVCQEEEYRLFVLAHVEQLAYLDYVLANDDERQRAQETFQDELMILQEKEIIEKTTNDKAAAEAAEIALLTRANLLVVQNLFEDMMEEDSEISKLRLLPGVNEMLEDYQDKLNEASEEFQTLGLEQHEVREKELKLFGDSIAGLRTKMGWEARSVIEEFLGRRKPIMDATLVMIRNVADGADDANNDSKMQGAVDDMAVREQLDQLRELLLSVDDVVDRLRELETNAGEIVEKMLNEFESRLGDLKNRNLEQQNIFFRKVEDLETNYAERMGEKCNSLAEKLSNGELDHLPDETKELIGNKEVLDTAVQGSNDIHIGKLLAREDEMRLEEVKRFKSVLEQYRTEKFEQGRKRMIEIGELRTAQRGELNVLIQDLKESRESYD